MSLKADLSVAADCYITSGDFDALAGQIVASKDSCGKFIGYSNAAGGDYSIGRYEYAHDVSDQISIEVTQRKLTGSLSRPIEIYFLGGAVGWAFTGDQAYYYIYESESHWTGWLPTSQIKAGEANKVSVHQSGKSIVVYANGNELDQYELLSDVTAKRVSIFFKGDPGVRESMEFDQFLVVDRSSALKTSAEADGGSLVALQSDELGRLPKADTLDLGDLGADSTSAPVRRIALRNTGTSPIASPSVVTSASGGAVELAMPAANACSSVTSLPAGTSCSVYVRAVSAEEHAVMSANSTAIPLAIAAGSSIKAVAARAQAAPAATTPKVTAVTPSVAQAGVRTLFTVVGTNLPTTVALKLDSSTCENSSKPSSYKIYCTPGSTSSGRVFVMSDSSSTAKQLSAKIVKISNPSLYRLPLDASYVKLANVSLEFGDYNSSVKKYHTGMDLMTSGANPAVYAIAEGTVVWNSTGSTKYTTDYDKYFNAFVIVRHGNFYAYYGHLKSNLRVGDTVAAGASLGTIRDGYNKNSTLNTSLNHLHLSISTGSDWQRSGWGYQATKEQAIALFVDPMKYAGL